MRFKKRCFAMVMWGAMALMMFIASPHAKATGSKVGFRLGVYTDAEELFLGAEALTPIAAAPLYFNPNVEFIFIEHGTFATFNFDFHYDFLTSSRAVLVWAGAGLGVLYRNPEGPIGGDADLGANLLFGIGFGRGPTIPYIQSKVILSDNTEVAIGFGLRF
jgi:hypothetical protein